MQTNSFLRGTKLFLKEHTPEILTGLGIAGMVTTTVLAVKATPKALKSIEETKEELNVHKLNAGQTIKATWKHYIPAAITGVASTACLIGANSVHAKRLTALAAAYDISTKALTEYREKVIETVGEKKEKEVREAIDKDRVEKNPVSNKEVIITGKGDTLCCDAMGERYFKSSKDEIVRVINELNRKMNYEGYVSLNDLYQELDLWPCPTGDVLGWKADWGLIQPSFSTQLADNGSTPCLVLGFFNPPRYGYDK